jgi:cell wall-associated NlpC family hydrolase
MHTKNFVYLLISVLLLSVACQRNKTEQVYPALNALVDSVRLQYVPDKRDNVFEINVVERDGKPVVKGLVSVAEAKTDLLEKVLAENPAAVDSIELLPDETVGEAVYGVVNVSVADMRTAGDYDAEMATQLLLGSPVQVLQRADWWRVKSAEGYVAWMPGSSFVRMNKTDFNQWITAKKIIFTADYGFAYETPDDNKGRVSDLVFGNLLKWESDNGRFFKVSYPDGRTAYTLKSQSKVFEEWSASIRLTEESIIQKALTLKGIPYTWGGTSAKMMDCSGFTKTVMLMHGIILRRDASQQAKTGIPVDISEGYDKLRPGDLLFFGKKAQDGKRERVRHVAFYMGNKQFIHEAGYVRINSLDPDSPNYDEYNTKEFIRACRIIGAVNTEGIWEINTNALYRMQE